MAATDHDHVEFLRVKHEKVRLGMKTTGLAPGSMTALPSGWVESAYFTGSTPSPRLCVRCMTQEPAGLGQTAKQSLS
jgi:hypothetical protein